jgi:TetR/AcrR family transcriptional regulator, transcriptional repressor for nem operon
VARTKEFDRDAALDRAMHVFWEKGYEAASLSELVDAMGIGRQSLYDTFGDKHALFLAALARYNARIDGTCECLATAPSVKRAIRDMFEAIIDESPAEHRRGCLGIGSVMERAGRDPATAALIASRQRSLEETFFRALERGRASGELAAGKDSRALARFLVAALQGLRVSAAGAPGSPGLRDVVRISLAALD